MIRRAALVLLACAVPAAGQTGAPADKAAIRTAMARLDWMTGTWRGEAVATTPAGERRITQTERVGPMLDGDLRVIEGKGFNPDGGVGFNAFAVISYDPGEKAYTFRSYSGGRAGTFAASVGENRYSWEIPAGPGAVMRYTAALEGGKWHETGEYVAPGQPARRVFEMTLTRIGTTDWPRAGGLEPR